MGLVILSPDKWNVLLFIKRTGTKSIVGAVKKKEMNPINRLHSYSPKLTDPHQRQLAWQEAELGVVFN